MLELADLSTELFIFLTIFSYLLGSISFGIIFARIFHLGNLRKMGSGNIGTTNVLRTGNYWAAGLTLLLDFAKGLLPVLAAINMLNDPLQIQIVALASFLGHLYPVWHRFKGGKGVATFFGIVFGISFPGGIICALVWLACGLLTRIASLSALLSVWAFPIGLILFGLTDFLYLSGILIVLIWFRHHSNLKRLLAGNETKIKF